MSAPASDCLTEEQQFVVQAILDGRSIFISGDPGVGKSHLVRALPAIFEENMISGFITAMTGVAAYNIEGCTTQSFFGIGYGTESIKKLISMTTDDTRERLQSKNTVLIDEISMMSGELFEKCDAVSRAARGIDKPFGGIQLVCVGDFYQLPPVFPSTIDSESGKRKQGDTRLVFETSLWQELFPKENQFHLTKVFRQHEPELIDLVREFRTGKVTSLDTIRNCMRPLVVKNGVQPTMLFSKRYNVQQDNENRLMTLPGTMWKSTATDKLIDMTKSQLDTRCQAPEVLQLKEGAQVMLLVNKKEQNLHNGSRGVVVSLGLSIAVRFLDGSLHHFPLHLFEYKDARGELEGSRSQYPFALSYAMTIHKAQGSSLDYVVVDLNGCFAEGQAYVAVSRARTLEGLEIRGFDRSCVKTDPRVVAYFNDIVSDKEVLEWHAQKQGKSVDEVRNEYRASKKPKTAA